MKARGAPRLCLAPILALLGALLPAACNGEDAALYARHSWVTVRTPCPQANFELCPELERVQANARLVRTGRTLQAGAGPGGKLWYEVRTPSDRTGLVREDVVLQPAEGLLTTEGLVAQLETGIQQPAGTGAGLKQLASLLRTWAEIRGMDAEAASVVVNFYGDLQVDIAMNRRMVKRDWDRAARAPAGEPTDWVSPGHRVCLGRMPASVDRELLFWRRWSETDDSGGFVALYPGDHRDEVWRCLGRWRHTAAADEVDALRLEQKVQLPQTVHRALRTAPEAVRITR